jgi:hypothetical protein
MSYFAERPIIMKTLILAMLAVVLTAPAVSFAQDTTDQLTRAQVRADLVQLENAGYRPVAQDAYYPADIQAAEARVHSGDSGSSAYGGVAETGTSTSRVPTSGPAVPAVSDGH